MSGTKEVVIETRFYEISRYMETEIKRRLEVRNCNQSEKDILSKYFQLKDIETELMVMYPEYKRVNYKIGVQNGASIQYDSAIRELERYELNINRNKAAAEELNRINVRKVQLKSHINELIKAIEVLLPAIEPAARSYFDGLLNNVDDLDAYSITSLETLEKTLIEQLKRIQSCHDLINRGSAFAGKQLSLITVSADDYATELAALEIKLHTELVRFQLDWDNDVPESFKLKIAMVKKSPWLDWLDSNLIPIEVAHIAARRDTKKAALEIIEQPPIDAELPQSFIDCWQKLVTKIDALLSNIDDAACDWNLIQHEHEQLCADIQSYRKRCYVKSLMTEKLLEQGLNVIHSDDAHGSVVYSEAQSEKWYEVFYQEDGTVSAQECIDDATTTALHDHEDSSLCEGFTKALLEIQLQKDADVVLVSHKPNIIKKKQRQKLRQKAR